MKKIICVCTENICRSPMLEVLLKKKLKDAGINNIKVDSAGLYVREGLTIQPNSKKAINQHGYRIGNRKAKQLKYSMITKDTLILTVTDFHKDALRNINNVVSLNDFWEGMSIPDPYGKDIDVYSYCFELMEEMATIVVEYIKNERLRW